MVGAHSIERHLVQSFVRSVGRSVGRSGSVDGFTIGYATAYAAQAQRLVIQAAHPPTGNQLYREPEYKQPVIHAAQAQTTNI